MKLSLFAPALIGMIGVHSVELPSQMDFNDNFYEQFAAQVESDANSMGAALGGAHTDADAACQETVNGVVLRLQTPECQQNTEAVEVNFESQMLQALKDLESKSKDLFEALTLQFAKNTRLQAGTAMNITGNVIVKPHIDSDPTDGASFTKQACEKKPASNGASITIKAEGAGISVADGKPAPKVEAPAPAKEAVKSEAPAPVAKVDAAADKKKADDKAAADKKTEDKAAADKKAADEKKTKADKEAADKKAATDKKKAEDEKKAADKEAEEKKKEAVKKADAAKADAVKK